MEATANCFPTRKPKSSTTLRSISLNAFFQRGDRTIDQMVQAAPSGKQNIAEASLASATSKETEIKLTNVARASLEELLVDYQDFLRRRTLSEWSPTHPFAKRLNDLIRKMRPMPHSKKGLR